MAGVRRGGGARWWKREKVGGEMAGGETVEERDSGEEDGGWGGRDGGWARWRVGEMAGVRDGTRARRRVS